MDTKERRHIEVQDINERLLAFGVLYQEGNVQLHWRTSIGWTAEQFQSIAPLLGIEPNACILIVTDSERRKHCVDTVHAITDKTVVPLIHKPLRRTE